MADFEQMRQDMVREQLVTRGVQNPRVLSAMGAVPREAFVPERYRGQAYADGALPIGSGQTISQPAVVAQMIEAAEVGPDDRVLEVGAGSGYAAAVMGQIAERVDAIERHEPLARRAAKRVRSLGYENVHIHAGDGSAGLAEAAPFDAIVVSAGGPSVPDALREQLAVGGRLVMPVGDSKREQEIVVIRRRSAEGYDRQSLGWVRFVPLIGAGGWAG